MKTHLILIILIIVAAGIIINVFGTEIAIGVPEVIIIAALIGVGYAASIIMNKIFR
jgi:hypothetical protein